MTVSDYLSVNSDSINVSKSLYLPRLTTFERDNLGFTPSEALIIYNTTDDCMEIYKNGVWSNIWCFHCAATIITQPFSATVCEWQDTSFIVSATGTSLTFQWQLSTDGGTIWNNISDGGISPFYIGSNTFMLSVSNISVGNNGYMFRCNITASCPPEITSSEVLLNVMANPPSITVNPINQALSSSYTASFSISSLGYNVIYQWQQSSDGINWNDISNGGTSPEYNGVTTNVLSLSDVPPSFNNYKFRCIAGNSCGTSAISTDATLSISAPSVSTTAASNIQSTSVTCGGNVLLNGGAAVTACGVCWSTSNDPSLSDSFTTDGSGTGSFVSSITGLTPGVTYYFRAYATNAIGTSYGIVRSFFTPTVDVGQSYQGGIVAYILQVGDPGYFSTVTHGIIVSESDQSSSANWGCYGTLISGADETGIGYGQQNTTDIIADCATAGIAAKICDDLVLNGYSDWYLPSKDELNKLYINKTLIGGFTNNYYWSSSEVTNNNANRQYFLNGTQNNTVKSFSCYVRAIRTF
ncbi:MAG: hypothetical protein A2033_10650 [Bacteroidetes bacterium GWA2_31_9]|nr:MAG: hypothetical protein A2033_10650 [Bacteroidetes bacterium GWA2_31_9]